MKQIFLNSGTYTYKPLTGKLDLEKYILSVLAKDTCCEKIIFADVITTGILNVETINIDGVPFVPSSGLSGYGMFYGLTAGTGNGGADDYPATVPVKTAAATGRVPFPRTGVTTAGVTLGPANPSSTPANNFDSVIVADAGVYEIVFTVHTTERGQLQLEVNGTDIAETLTTNANPTSGGHIFVGSSILTLPAGAVIAVVNATGNATALTITQADGNLTHANAQRLTVKKLA